MNTSLKKLLFLLLIVLGLIGIFVLYMPDPVDAVQVDIFDGNRVSPFTVEVRKTDVNPTIGKRLSSPILIGSTEDEKGYMLVIGEKGMFIMYHRWLLGGFMTVDFRYQIKNQADKKKLMKLYERYIQDKGDNQKEAEQISN